MKSFTTRAWIAFSRIVADAAHDTQCEIASEGQQLVDIRVLRR